MTMRHERGRGRKLAEETLRTFTKRWVAVAAILVAAAVATVVAASATTHASSSAQVAVARASSLQPSMAGGGKSTKSLKHRTAVRGHLPKSVKRSHPRELHLKAAHSKVFDVRKLKSKVVKKERPERAAPGYALPGSRAAERLENPARTAPQLPKIIKRSQMIDAPAPAPSTTFDGLDFANWGAGHPPDTNGDVGPDVLHPDDQQLDRDLRQVERQPRRRVHVQRLHEPGQLRQPLRHRQLRRPGRPLRHLRGPLGHHRLRLQARRLGQRQSRRPCFECFAVSKTGDPVTGGWNFYSIQTPGGLGDYPKFGVWPDGIYMSANMFGYSAERLVHLGCHVWALNKAQMYAGEPPVQVVDFAGAGRPTSRCSRPTPGCRPGRRRRAARVLRLDLAVPERAVGLQVPRRLGQDLDLDVHRARQPSSRRPAGPTRLPANASTPANAADVARDPGDGADPVLEHRRRRVALGGPHRAPRRASRRELRRLEHEQRDRALVPGQRHRRHRRGERRPGQDLRSGGREHVLPLHAEPGRRPHRRHGARLQQVELDHQPADQVRGPARGDPVNTLQPDRADADRRHRRADRQLRRLGLHPLGRLQRHGARPERLQVLDDGRVLRRHRPQPPDPDRRRSISRAARPSATARSRAPSPTAATRSPARRSRSAAGRPRRTAAGSYSFTVPAGTYAIDDGRASRASTPPRPRPSSSRTAGR